MEKGNHTAILFTSEFKPLMKGKKIENKFYAFNLGWDFCAEHEWGISELLYDFGVPYKEKIGLERVTITRHTSKWGNTIKYEEIEYKNEKFKVLSYPRSPSLSRFVYLDKQEDFYSAWDGRGFAIAVNVKNETVIKYLDDLYKAFKKNDVCLMMANRQTPFGNRGLVLAIRSRIPQEFDDYLKD